jgi:hypothetical protein
VMEAGDDKRGRYRETVGRHPVPDAGEPTGNRDGQLVAIRRRRMAVVIVALLCAAVLAGAVFASEYPRSEQAQAEVSVCMSQLRVLRVRAFKSDWSSREEVDAQRERLGDWFRGEVSVKVTRRWEGAKLTMPSGTTIPLVKDRTLEVSCDPE